MKTTRILFFSFYSFFSAFLFIILPFSSFYLSDFSLFCDILLFDFLFIGALSGGYRKKKSILLLRKFKSNDSRYFIQELEKKMKHDYRIVTLSINDISARHNIKISYSEGCMHQILFPLGIFMGIFIKEVAALSFENNFLILKNLFSFEFPFILHWSLPFLVVFFFIKGSIEKKAFINDDKDVQRILNKINKFNSRLFSINATQPSLLTIISKDKFWQKLVQELIKTANFIIIDTSVQTEHIDWEIKQLANNRNVIYLVKDRTNCSQLDENKKIKIIEIHSNKKAMVDHIMFVLESRK